MWFWSLFVYCLCSLCLTYMFCAQPMSMLGYLAHYLFATVFYIMIHAQLMSMHGHLLLCLFCYYFAENLWSATYPWLHCSSFYLPPFIWNLWLCQPILLCISCHCYSWISVLYCSLSICYASLSFVIYVYQSYITLCPFLMHDMPHHWYMNIVLCYFMFISVMYELNTYTAPKPILAVYAYHLHAFMCIFVPIPICFTVHIHMHLLLNWYRYATADMLGCQLPWLNPWVELMSRCVLFW